MEFNAGINVLKPKSCGLKFGDLTMEEVEALSADLTEEEKASPHAKYFYQEPVKIPEDVEHAINAHAIDPEEAFMPKEYGMQMCNRGYNPIENGYCVLPNGVSYGAVLIKQEGRTDEMVKFYNENFAPEKNNLFYKTWCPGCHYLHYDDGAVEDFGWGKMNLKFTRPIDIRDLGIDPETVLERDPDCIFISGNNATCYPVDGGKPGNIVIMNYYRRIPGGRENRMRIWYGVSLIDGEYIYSLDEGERMSDNIARCTMSHLAHEYSNDARLMRQFWDEYHGKDVH